MITIIKILSQLWRSSLKFVITELVMDFNGFTEHSKATGEPETLESSLRL
jgi:hypothetical protein